MLHLLDALGCNMQHKKKGYVTRTLLFWSQINDDMHAQREIILVSYMVLFVVDMADHIESPHGIIYLDTTTNHTDIYNTTTAHHRTYPR